MTLQLSNYASTFPNVSMVCCVMNVLTVFFFSFFFCSLHPDPNVPDTGFTEELVKSLNSVHVVPTKFTGYLYGTRWYSSLQHRHLLTSLSLFLKDQYSTACGQAGSGDIYRADPGRSNRAIETSLGEKGLHYADTVAHTPSCPTPG